MPEFPGQSMKLTLDPDTKICQTQNTFRQSCCWLNYVDMSSHCSDVPIFPSEKEAYIKFLNGIEYKKKYDQYDHLLWSKQDFF